MKASTHRTLGLTVILMLIAAATSGCGSSSTSLGAPLGSLNILGAASDTPSVVENETNDQFDLATLANPSAGRVRLSGSIETLDDVDVYDVGSVQRGDRIIISTNTGGSLDATAAVFDQDQNLLYANDDRSWRIDTRPYIDFIVRANSSVCYVVIAATEGSPGTGTYSLQVRIDPDHAVPAPREQVVVLDFDGANGATVGNLRMDVPAFDAADIDPSFAGETDEVINAIEDTIREDYAGYDVEIYSTAEGNLPGGPYTTVYMGSYNPGLLGLADYVDYYNEDLTQEAIVFIETFALFMPYQPTAEEMGLVIANVASHELGHLLGLNHTADATEIMDTTATAPQMLFDQDFHQAPLNDDVFPIGYQDADELLASTVGRS